MPDNRTPSGWPLPHPDNRASDDAVRIAEALTQADAAIVAVGARLPAGQVAAEAYADAAAEAAADVATEAAASALAAHAGAGGAVHAAATAAAAGFMSAADKARLDAMPAGATIATQPYVLGLGYLTAVAAAATYATTTFVETRANAAPSTAQVLWSRVFL